MKAISGYPQWFWLCAKGWKDIENRNWATKYRGRILLHASKHIETCISGFIKDWLTPEQWAEFSQVDWNMYAGHIIGEVDIVDCKFRFGEENDNLYSPWHIPGQYGFVLASSVLYDKPIPWRGRPGIFEIPCWYIPGCGGRGKEEQIWKCPDFHGGNVFRLRERRLYE